MASATPRNVRVRSVRFATAGRKQLDVVRFEDCDTVGVIVLGVVILSKEHDRLACAAVRVVPAMRAGSITVPPKYVLGRVSGTAKPGRPKKAGPPLVLAEE